MEQTYFFVSVHATARLLHNCKNEQAGSVEPTGGGNRRCACVQSAHLLSVHVHISCPRNSSFISASRKNLAQATSPMIVASQSASQCETNLININEVGRIGTYSKLAFCELTY